MSNIREDYQRMYLEKRTSLEECLKLIRSNDNICFAKDCNEPKLFCENLHTIADRVENVTILKGRSSDFGFLQNDGMAGHFLPFERATAPSFRTTCRTSPSGITARIPAMCTSPPSPPWMRTATSR